MSDISMLPGLAEIRQRFFLRLSEKIIHLENALAALSTPDNPSKSERLLAAEAVLHSVAGAAGTLGLADISDRARGCEEAIIALTRRGEGSEARLRSDLLEFLQIAKRTVG